MIYFTRLAFLFFMKGNLLIEKYPELSKEIDYDKNKSVKINIDNISSGSNKKFGGYVKTIL